MINIRDPRLREHSSESELRENQEKRDQQRKGERQQLNKEESKYRGWIEGEGRRIV